MRIDLEDGVPVFRASAAVPARIEALIDREREGVRSADERDELDGYEALDDHFSQLNRLARNPLHD